MSVTSVNLATLPFMGSCDSTRAQMASKQMAQSLTHPDCEIPYVISNEYRSLTENSRMGIKLAQDDGTVVFNYNDVLIVFYSNLKTVDVSYIPPIKKTNGTFASKLRYALNEGDKFTKGDILFSYDCFRCGVPSFGYNVFTGYFTLFGYNHEDGLTVSESFADKAKCQFTETVYIPVFEYSLFQPLYQSDENSLIYFPGVGTHVRENNVCSKLNPKGHDNNASTSDLKHKMMMLLKSMNVSDLLNINSHTTPFTVEPVKTKVDHGKVTGIKIHKLRTNVTLVDSKLQEMLDNLHSTYFNDYIIPGYSKINNILGENYAKQTTRQFMAFKDKNPITNRKTFKNCVYLIELEVSSEHPSMLGDKFCNRFANKGVVSMIMPDELRPIAVSSQTPIDMVFNPFGVFSRMNLSQLLEGVTSKNVMYADRYIKENPDDLINSLEWLNNGTIQYFDEPEYFNHVQSLIKNLKSDSLMRKQFVENIQENNLFIEAPSFSRVRTKDMYKHAIPTNEKVLIKRETLMYIKQTMKVDIPFPTSDVELENIFCAPIYIQKLYKLASHIISARDLGAVKHITKQPLKGRAHGGGSRVGQMELEGILAHGCDHALKEILTVKSDYEAGKKDLIEQLVRNGEYNFPEVDNIEGGTKRVVSTLIKFIQE